MARDRADGFVFDAHRFLRETLGLLPVAVAAYATLHASSWDMAEAGVLPGDDRTLAQLARLTPEEWGSVRDQVARLFDTESRPGAWIHRCVADAHAAQRRAFDRRSTQARRAGIESAKSRSGIKLSTVRSTLRQRLVNGQSNATSTGVGVGESSQPPCRWRDRFAAFWARYPHRRGRSHRKPAEALWMRVEPKTDEHFSRIMAGLERSRSSPDWLKAGGEFVEAAEKYIRRAGWDASDGSANGSLLIPPSDGERQRGPSGEELVYFRGGWRTLESAEAMGWRPDRIVLRQGALS